MRPLRVGGLRPAPQPVGAAALVHQGGGGHRPAVAHVAHHHLGLDHGVGEEHLVERGMAVHLLQRMDLHAGLLHVEDEVGQPLVLGHVPVGARQQQAPVRLVGAGGPHLLAVDHPLVALAVGARDGARHVRAAARLAEQLAPGVLAGEDAAQELLLMQVGAVVEDGGGGQGADARLGDADRADAGELLVDDGVELHRQVAAVPLLGPVRRAPARFDQLGAPFDQAVVGLPVGFQPGPHFGADGALGRFAHGRRPSVLPVLHHQFAMLVGIAEQDLASSWPA